jgi:hypothetical protein
MKGSLSVQFGLWIVGGLALLCAIVAGDFFDCRARVDVHQVEPAKSDAAGRLPPLNLLDPSGSEPSLTAQEPGGWVKPQICEARFTDLGVLFLTYCLAIIGWFTIRSNEQTVRILERALVFTGPTNIGGKESSGLTRYGSHIWKTGAVRILAVNQGRTPALVTFAHGEFSDAEPTGASPSYDMGKGDYLCDFALAANSLPNSGALPAEWIFDWRDQFFFGFVEYRDVFGKMHTSRFCAKLIPEKQQYDIAGSAAYRAFD